MISVNDRQKMQINIDKLPEECKTFLDVIDVINETPTDSKKELLGKLNQEKEDVKHVLNKHIDNLNFVVVDELLDNINRVTKAEEFVKNVIE